MAETSLAFIKKRFPQKGIIPLFVIILGICLRLWASTKGYNFDIDSYIIVAKIMEKGGNVYLETARYNYGPVWFYILHILYQIAALFSRPDIALRYIVAGFVSLTDVGIFFFLLKKFGRTAAYLFFLNPISMIISGYHSQFDNLAILLGMCAVTIIGENFNQNVNMRKITGLGMLGLSLMTKYIFFIFPFWLAVKQKGLKSKAIVLILPIVIFLLGFAPYWKGSSPGIIQNVFLYESFNNQLFYRLFVPEVISRFINAFSLWILLLVGGGLVFRSESSFKSLLLYTGILVAASPSTANQYLAIVVPLVSVYPNIFNLLYSILGTIYLVIDNEGFHFTNLQENLPISERFYCAILISLLTMGFVWLNCRESILMFLRKSGKEIKEALS